MPKLVSPLDNKEASFFYFWLLNFMKLQTNGAPWKTFRDPLDTASHFNWLHSIPQLVRGFVLLTKHGWSGTGTKKTPVMSANYMLEIWIIHYEKESDQPLLDSAYLNIFQSMQPCLWKQPKNPLNMYKRKQVVTAHAQLYLKAISFHKTARGSVSRFMLYYDFPNRVVNAGFN